MSHSGIATNLDTEVSNAGQTADTPAPPGRLRLLTLGSFALDALDCRGETPRLIGPGKPLALLCYLACVPQRSASRDQLIDLLWSDHKPDAARHTLRQTTYYLRQRVGELLVVDRQGRVSLRGPLDSDRSSFLAAIERVDLEDAVAAYTGDFVPDFGAPGAVAFEHWADLERERLRLMFLGTAEELARRWLTAARFRDAQLLARRLRDHDPSRQATWRLLLEVLCASGDDMAAAAEARALERTLASDDCEPEPATVAALQVVSSRSEPVHVASPAPLVADLVGREREFSTIVAAWEAARTGKGRHVHVVAPAGLGKSRLLGDVQRRLRARGDRALYLRANPGERDVPAALAAELAGMLGKLPGAAAVAPASAGILVALSPSLSSRFAAAADHASGRDALRRRALAVAELMTVVADEQPVAVLIDDIHWADEESRRVLEFMASRVSQCSILLVTTARPSGSTAPIGEAGVTITLRHLGVDDVAAMVDSLGETSEAAWNRDFGSRLCDASGGVPLLVLETLKLAIDQGMLVLEERRWRCVDTRALDQLLQRGAALRHRLASLDVQQKYILSLLALSGTPLDEQQVVAAMANHPLAVQPRLTLRLLEERGLTIQAEGAWMPTHDEIAESAIAMATPEALKEAHGSLGRVLSSGPASAEQLLRAARHLECGGYGSDSPGVLARRVFILRDRGDRRPLAELVEEVIGGQNGERFRDLQRSLPLSLRIGLYNTRRKAAAILGAGFVVAGSLAFALSPEAGPPEAMLMIVSADRAAKAIPIRDADWHSNRLLRPIRRAPAVPGIHERDHALDALSPAGNSWVVTRVSGDSERQDLYLISGASQRRLTFSSGDDYSAQWAPDGRRILYSSSRWHRHGMTDLMVLDVATATSTMVTDSAGSIEQSGLWSPSGTRVAFMRQDRHGDFRREICWAWPGEPPSCLPNNSEHQRQVVGWYGEDELIIQVAHEPPTWRLVRHNLRDGSVTTIVAGWQGDPAPATSGRWIACRCRRPGDQNFDWYVFRTEAPESARRVDVDGAPAGQRAFWYGLSGVRRITMIAIDAPPDTLHVGVPHRLMISAFDELGDPIPAPRPRWRSSDTSVVVVQDTSGVLLPRRPGVVRIQATSGTHRISKTMAVVENRAATSAMEEDWLGGLAAWVPFGTPFPAVVNDRGRLAFFNGGDGWYLSGAYSRRSFDATQGLGVETSWSTPVIGPTQQFNDLSLMALDSQAMAAWNHRDLRPREDAMLSHCRVAYPNGDEIPSPPYVVLEGTRLPIHQWANTGRWYTVRLQLFPDGRCGVAMNGKPLAIVEGRGTARSLHVVLWGNSQGSRMLMGAVHVWQGVRTDLDWSALILR